jgi:hypothetical protein
MTKTTKMFALGEVKAVEDADGDPNGEFDVILSAPTLDRDGEVLDAKIFEPLPDHITFDIDHGMSTATTVGSGKPFYDGDVLRVKGTYSSIPRAQEVRTLVREGHIRTTSVAFMGAVREEKDGIPHVVKAELLNGAFVPIPSNRESVVLSAKTYSEKADSSALRPTAPFGRKAVGDMTANALREELSRAVREAYGDEETYTWVRDYTDEWVVFEAEGPDSYSLWQHDYAVDGNSVTLEGSPTEVTARTTYEPITAPADSTPAPETPADEESAGKHPALVQARVLTSIERLRLDIG